MSETPAEPTPTGHIPGTHRIDWAEVPLTTEEDALALWRQLAPTGADWEAKLEVVPADVGKRLALALLREGNITCAVPTPPDDCRAPLHEVPAPASTDGLDAPCLRRLLALWSLAQLEPADGPALMSVLEGLVALAPPEEDLVSAALDLVSDTPASLLQLLVIAQKAGHHEAVTAALGDLDERQLQEAVTRHHLDGALEILSAEAHRPTYLHAVTDRALAGPTRVMAMRELAAADASLPADLRTSLVRASRDPDCTVAAQAAHLLTSFRQRGFAPARPRTSSPAVLMRALCILAAYEQLRGTGEPSLLTTYVPAKGLEQVTVTYDPLSDEDLDGDGDPHTQRNTQLIPRADVHLPEPGALASATCEGTTCRTRAFEFRFDFRHQQGALLLTRLELAERPPCPTQ